MMQAASDSFLGWHQSGWTEVQYYWRQLKDMKGSVDVAVLDEKGLGTYLAVCSWCLARAHARTGDSVAIAGYLGKSDSFDKAIGKFAVAYADQNQRDHQALVDAIESGRLQAQEGI
jgi:predicted alpha/beta hydrolase